MMNKIVELDHALANKIAAGEVVERPASVVKELVENAIDAKSTVIEIGLEEAGLQKIRVIDNGNGIEEDDVLTAFKRHATSKIKDENDLFRIRTLGFRGEALPSIAAVSMIEMITSTGESAGTRIVIDGGEVIETGKAASRKGTDITVSGLFYNTPARLKHMKTIHTELGNVTNVVNRLALAHPDISIRLRHHDRILLQTNGNGSIHQVLAAIYGTNVAKKMIPISATSLDFQIDGYIALPEVTRASRNYISTMINSRFIKNYNLAQAIQAGYHTLLPIGRYPIALLMIEMDPILVDVNVHPSKLEVRLSKEKELNRLITETIRSAFKKETLIPAGDTVRHKKGKTEQTALQLDHLPTKKHDHAKRIEKNRQIRKEQHSWQRERQLPSEQMNILSENIGHQASSVSNVQKAHAVFPEVVKERQEYENQIEDRSTTKEMEENASRVPVMYPIGQMHGTYIFAQNDNGLYIIDQHAAQERIKYEYYKKKVGEVERELQELLIPLTLEFSTDEFIKIEENREQLEKVGVFLEPFGHNSFIVRSHPTWFPKGEEQELIKDMIDQLLSMKRVDINQLREEAAIMMSCKRSIKANEYLRNDEIQALLDKLRMTSDPFTCPHGRPIIIHFSTYEMEKMFKRVM